uniref:E3 ubiquitin-protein ligase PPP1R11 n=1 Tax=Caligus rogercresseyi TaxID=217165 RepID=C1BRB6_CALRO|nr:phosphatase 1 regulatory subunit 11 [Caligus rogercresseyi]
MSGTVTRTEETGVEEDQRKFRLKLRSQREKKVNWEEGTVDNEELGRKKSKCCCVYKKPRAFGESSSSEDEDESCKDCIGHIKPKK